MLHNGGVYGIIAKKESVDMKKLISILLALVLIFSVTAVPVVADTETGTLPFLKNIILKIFLMH